MKRLGMIEIKFNLYTRVLMYMYIQQHPLFSSFFSMDVCIEVLIKSNCAPLDPFGGDAFNKVLFSVKLKLEISD